MTVLERKQYIKARIDSTQDEAVLEKIEQMLKENEAVYHFTPEQLASVQEALAQYERGEYFTEEEDEKYFDEWFRQQEK